MVCKTCRKDLDSSFFTPAIYLAGLLTAQPQHCMECNRLPKAAKKAVTREFLERNLPLKRKRTKAQKRAERVAKITPEDIAWRKMNPSERHANMLTRRTPSEIKLQAALEAHKVVVDPQRPAGPYFIDLAVPTHKLAIEVDGEYHETEKQKEKDRVRENQLTAMKWRVIRFKNEDISRDVNLVVKEILYVLGTCDPANTQKKKNALCAPPVAGWHAAPAATSFDPATF